MYRRFAWKSAGGTLERVNWGAMQEYGQFLGKGNSECIGIGNRKGRNEVNR